MLNRGTKTLLFGVVLGSSVIFANSVCWADVPTTQNDSSAKTQSGNENPGFSSSQSSPETLSTHESGSEQGSEAMTESGSESGGGFIQGSFYPRPNKALPSGLPPYLVPSKQSDYVKTGSSGSDYAKGTNSQPSDYVKGSDSAPSDYVKSGSPQSDYAKNGSQPSDYVKSTPEPSNWSGGSK